MEIKGYKNKQFKNIISKLCIDDYIKDYTIIIYKYKIIAIIHLIFFNGQYCSDIYGICNNDLKIIEIYMFKHKIKSTRLLNTSFTIFHELYHAIQFNKYRACYDKDMINYKKNYNNSWIEVSANSFAKHNMIKFKTYINKIFKINYKWHIK